MPYTAMPTYTTAELIPVGDINTWVANIDHIQTKTYSTLLPPLISTSGSVGALAISSGGRLLGAGWQDSATAIATGAFFNWFAPTNLNTIESANVVYYCNTTTTVEWDARLHAGAIGESYDTHGAVSNNNSVSVTANLNRNANIISLFADVTAGDMVGVNFGPSSGTGSEIVYAVGLLITYTLL